MSQHTRRTFLKTGAAIGSLLGFSGLGFKAHGQVAADTITDPYFPERPPRINNSSVFLRQTSVRPRPTGKIPVLQGATSQTQTQFRILIQSDQIYRYFISDKQGSRRQVSAKMRFGVPTSQSLVDHVYVDGLIAGESYRLEIEVSGGSDLSEVRQFSTMGTKNGVGDPLRVALISCMNDRYVDDQAEMWAAVAKSGPELMLFNGDCCYVDQRASGTVEGMWDRHVTTRRMLDVFKWDHLVPILTTWDDHDAGENDADANSPYLDTAREYFTGMFGSDPVDGYSQSSAMPYSFDTHGMRIIMLDDRSGKSENQVFSPLDEAWLAQAIASSPGPICLVNAMQFFGGYLIGAESVEDLSTDQLWRILKYARNASVPMILMSGDVHFSELMELEPELLGYKSYELTSSAIHSRTVPGQQYRSYNGRRIESTSRYNFMALEMTARSKVAVEIELACLGSNDREFFRLNDTIKK